MWRPLRFLGTCVWRRRLSAARFLKFDLKYGSPPPPCFSARVSFHESSSHALYNDVIPNTLVREFPRLAVLARDDHPGRIVVFASVDSNVLPLGRRFAAGGSLFAARRR